LAQWRYHANHAKNGKIWDLFCFFEPQYDKIDIPYETVNSAVNYRPNAILTSFRVISKPAKVTNTVKVIDETPKVHITASAA
jgi:hypothetical protein